jgi:NDP-sugar pyrophosphorylase family protein
MNHVVIEDGCHIQGSVVCNNVQLQERAVLKDCQVICTPYSKNRSFCNTCTAAAGFLKTHVSYDYLICTSEKVYGHVFFHTIIVLYFP